MALSLQIAWLFLLALPIACVSWTWTHEEIFREIHEYFTRQCAVQKSLILRKICFALTCEFCFSHYVTIGALMVTNFRLLTPGWTGLVLAGFALVWIANIYMTLMAMLRGELKLRRLKIDRQEDRAKVYSPEKAHAIRVVSAR